MRQGSALSLPTTPTNKNITTKQKMDKFKGKYRIPSTRLQHWNYGDNGSYFITICTENRTHFFGECKNRKMKLSTLGAIVQGFWYEIPKHFPFITLGEFTVMPNHVHGILIVDKTENQQDSSEKLIGNKRFQNQGKNTISSIVGSYKSICTRHINMDFSSLGFGWQERFWDSIIKDEKSFIRISQYIINNPSNWEDDMFAKNEDLPTD
jgi:putative transposase